MCTEKEAGKKKARSKRSMLQTLVEPDRKKKDTSWKRYGRTKVSHRRQRGEPSLLDPTSEKGSSGKGTKGHHQKTKRTAASRLNKVKSPISTSRPAKKGRGGRKGEVARSCKT